MSASDDIKSSNEKLAADWKRSDIIHEYKTLDQKLSAEARHYNPLEKINGKTLEEILKIAKDKQTEPVYNSEHDTNSDINLAGHTHHDAHD